IAAHRSLFRDELFAERLPPLEADGTRHLWEALGRHFTGMSYAEADFLSSRDKAFIRDLFPGGMIYASVLSDQAQRVIGEVGAQTKGVEKMLRRIGFSYAERVDPFDGGPHFIAETDQVTLVQQTKRLEVSESTPSKAEWGLLAKNDEGPPFFRARRAQGEVSEEYLLLPTETREAFGLKPGDPVYFLPLGRPSA
ncbi:MAG: arginine N-succinyltransferase, partial [Myxococcales bacterium]|nr:arginine N-succinyltransferase [Myxococcales bacterium]